MIYCLVQPVHAVVTLNKSRHLVHEGTKILLVRIVQYSALGNLSQFRGVLYDPKLRLRGRQSYYKQGFIILWSPLEMFIDLKYHFDTRRANSLELPEKSLRLFTTSGI